MDFDSILDEIGEFGKYQVTNYLLICLPVFFAAANSLSYVFTAAISEYRCFVPDCDSEFSEYEEEFVSFAVPGKINPSGQFIPAQCQRFHRNMSTSLPEVCAPYMFTQTEERCSEWVFADYERTIVNDWYITCPENQWKLALVGTMHFAGIVVGSGAFGVLADRFGRKIIFIISILLMSITGVAQGLSPNYEVFLLFGFLNAIGTSGVFPLAFIIGVEMVGRKKRDISGIVLNYFYALGEASVALVAWLCKDWVLIQLIVSAPPFLFIVYYWLVPESVRWLLAKQRHQKAGKIIRRAAAVNGVKLSDATLTELRERETDSENDLLDSPVKTRAERNATMLETLKEVIRSRVMVLRGLILFYNWATCAFVFYGLSLNSVNLSGNKYINFALVSLVEIPGYSLAWYLMNRIGRRWSLAGSLFLSGSTCVAGAFATSGTAEIILFLIGKLGITASFAVIYVHSAEMLPTIIRSGGVGSMSTMARVGALVAPFVPLLSNIHEAIPLLLFGLVSLIGGGLILFLPETMGRKLPDTVKEAINIARPENTIQMTISGDQSRSSDSSS